MIFQIKVLFLAMAATAGVNEVMDTSFSIANFLSAEAHVRPPVQHGKLPVIDNPF